MTPDAVLVASAQLKSDLGGIETSPFTEQIEHRIWVKIRPWRD